MPEADTLQLLGRCLVVRILGVVCGASIVTSACGGGGLKPATLDTRHDACASCRMAVSDAHLAAQIVVPGEEPRFFDDLGCLAAYLGEHPVAVDAAIFVTDHRSGEWIAANTATFTVVTQLETPMGSHLIAHADIQSRDDDAIARGGRGVDRRSVLGGVK
jgi:copper chaperone NosL